MAQRIKTATKEELKKMTYDEMHKADLVPFCKKKYPDIYREKYYQEFLKWPQSSGSDNYTVKIEPKAPAKYAIEEARAIILEQRCFALHGDVDYSTLHKNGKLAEVKAEFPSVYARLYFEAFGVYPK